MWQESFKNEVNKVSGSATRGAVAGATLGTAGTVAGTVVSAGGFKNLGKLIKSAPGAKAGLLASAAGTIAGSALFGGIVGKIASKSSGFKDEVSKVAGPREYMATKDEARAAKMRKRSKSVKSKGWVKEPFVNLSHALKQPTWFPLTSKANIENKEYWEKLRKTAAYKDFLSAFFASEAARRDLSAKHYRESGVVRAPFRNIKTVFKQPHPWLTQNVKKHQRNEAYYKKLLGQDASKK